MRNRPTKNPTGLDLKLSPAISLTIVACIPGGAILVAYIVQVLQKAAIRTKNIKGSHHICGQKSESQTNDRDERV